MLKEISQNLCHGCGKRPSEPERLLCQSCLRHLSWHGKPRDEVDAIRESSIAEVVAKDGAIQISDSQGKPILAIVPWPAYLRLLKSSQDHKVITKQKRPAGRPPIPNAHVLKSLILDHPDLSSAQIAAEFYAKTGQVIERSTVFRYRRRMDRASGGLVINGVDLRDYYELIIESAIKAGARPETARESEEYADGLIGLYEAAEAFESGDFKELARDRIKKAIWAGKGERKSRRVVNFSEIGNQDFDFASIIDQNGRVSND